MGGEGTPEERRRRLLARIAREAGVPDLASVLGERLSPTDLQSLLLEVYANRARRKRPSTLLEEYASNRFVRPSPVDVAALQRWEAIAWAHLPEGFQGVELAPVAPLGTSSVLAPVSQDWSVATSRNTEVVSDSTNVLALEACRRRASLIERDSSSAVRVHLASSHRLLRGQAFAARPGVHPHFRLFALVSAGRDPGHLEFEAEVTRQHVRFYLEALRQYLGEGPRFRVTVAALGGAEGREAIGTKLVDRLRTELPGVDLEGTVTSGDGRSYYRAVRFQIYVRASGTGEKELVDGGDVDWSQRLLNNRKERMLISGIGSERLAEFFPPSERSPPDRTP